MVLLRQSHVPSTVQDISVPTLKLAQKPYNPATMHASTDIAMCSVLLDIIIIPNSIATFYCHSIPQSHPLHLPPNPKFMHS